jgi:putative tryptophan/tyrosine transport system substrate-binding protein
MRRRNFVQLLSSAMIMVPWRVAAQTTTKNYHLASLTASSPFLTNSPYIAMLLPALAEHGYKLGQNLEYTPYGADMQLDHLPQIARDITANKIDAVVAFGYPPAAAMKGSSIPTVVAFGAGDPVATGLVDSLARPGGNVTGISDNATMLSTKRLGLLKQAAPNIRTVARKISAGLLSLSSDHHQQRRPASRSQA